MYALKVRLDDLIRNQQDQLKTTFPHRSRASLSVEASEATSSTARRESLNCKTIPNHLVLEYGGADMVSSSGAFYGPTNVFVQLLKLGRPVDNHKVHLMCERSQGLFSSTSPFGKVIATDISLPPSSEANFLISIFRKSVNVFYPTFQQATIEGLYAAASDESQPNAGSGSIPTLYLVCAIVMHTLSKTDRRMAGTSVSYFQQALSEWQRSSEVSRTGTVRIGVLL